MAQEGSSAPRRALGPLPEEPDAPTGGRFGRAFSPDEPSPLTSTGQLRRLAASPSSPASPVDPLDVRGTTPVPPPAPVLPEPESALPASAGRRFSASAEPSEFISAAPRRSAVSVSSPPSPPDAFLPPSPRPSSASVVTNPPAFTPSPFAPSPAASSPLASSASASAVGSYPRSVPTAPTAPSSGPTPFGALGEGVTGAGTPVASTPSSTSTPSGTPEEPLSRRGQKALAKAEARSAAQAKKAEDAAAAEAKKADAAAAAEAKKAGAAARKTEAKARRSGKGTPVAAAVPSEPPAATTPPPVAATAAEEPRRRTARPALIIMAAVAAVVLLVAAGVWVLSLRSGAPSGTPTVPNTSSALDPLVTAADLGTVGDVTWTEATGTADAVTPTCLPATGSGLPSPSRSASRRVPVAGSDVDALVQVVDTYADEATATQAYGLRLTQAGTCSNDAVWITGASAVTGLADSAEAVKLVVQDQASVFHTLLISRTGRSVSLVDLATSESAVNALDVATVVGKALSRQCGGDLGTCPSSIEATTEVPPAGDPAGWLVEADLPRITLGTGRWGATDPFTTLTIPGSQCEGINLETVSGTTSAAQRTLLLADDESAPQGFGVDMVVYTFGAADDASSLSAKLTKNISGCSDRAPTATVADGPSAKGTGAADTAVSGSTWTVTQKTATTTVVYRVAVITAGTRVVYLLANPSSDYDFTDAQWKAITLRAGQRVTQS
ncbi:MAG: hypothetical protein QM779_17640 [Propionicimonas sp.]|uniref:hypothetical protein n=1 Tax=Propionicimonas sp. TaxID=1955623 RepID=UPI003D0CAF16